MNEKSYSGFFALPRQLARAGLNLWLCAPVALLLWVALWANLNTGPWNFENENLDLVLAARSAVPYFAAVAGFWMLLARWPHASRELGSGASKALLGYALCVLVSTFWAPNVETSLYFDLAFLAAVTLAMRFSQQGADGAPLARDFVLLNWAVVTFAAVCVIYAGRGMLMSEGSAYGFHRAVEAQTRSSGAARFCAVPALVALCRFWRGRGLSRWAWLSAFLIFAAIVYKLQSRGAIFGIAFAALFYLLLEKGRLRAFALLVLVALGLTAYDGEMKWVERVREHIARGQSEDQFRSMTGRTRAWEEALEAFKESTWVFGYGNWADRSLIGTHVHNAFLQALLFGGLLGLCCFVWSWIRSWLDFCALYRQRFRLDPEDRLLLLEAGTVLAFFTVRSIPETTSASFSVDLLVIAPIVVYFEALVTRLCHREKRRKS